MSYDDDAAYDEARDYQVMTEFRLREMVDKDYAKADLICRRINYSLPVADRFISLCNDLIAGMKIAVKIKDGDLQKRFWISDVLEGLVGVGATHGGCAIVPFSIEESQRMAAAFAPAIPLLNEWAAGREKYECGMDFETGMRPRTLAGEIEHTFLWMYNRLISQGHTSANAAHPIIFIPVRGEDGTPKRYVFRTGQFQALLGHCKFFKERHPATSKIDRQFREEMKKPFEERFFNVEDDYDDAFENITDTDEMTARSRLKAYMQYRQQTLPLHDCKFGEHNGFDYVRDFLKKRLEVLQKGSIVDLRATALLYERKHDWCDLLSIVLKAKHWITYHDYSVDNYSESDKTEDHGYGENYLGPYFEVDENIPEHDLCVEVVNRTRDYIELLAAFAAYLHSSTYAQLAEAYGIFEKKHGWFMDMGYPTHKYDDRDLKKVISAIRDTQKQLAIDVRLFKIGRSIFTQFDPGASTVVSAILNNSIPHTQKVESVLDAVHQKAEEIREQQNEALDVAKATNERVQTGVAMIRSLKKYNTVGKPFGFGDQKLCFGFWVHDRVSPTLVHGRKVFYVDSFEAHKERLAQNGVTDVGIYRKLIEDYIKRTGKKIPNTKRKLAAAKSESGNGKRKNARGKRKSTPGKRKRKSKTEN